MYFNFGCAFVLQFLIMRESYVCRWSNLGKLFGIFLF